MTLRAPDKKDEHGWQVFDGDELVGHATSRDKARKAAAGARGFMVPFEQNGQPERVEGTVLPPAPKTEEELAADTAHAINEEIKTLANEIRGLWVKLAGQLYIFQQGKMWEALGYETFHAYLADPEVEIKTRWAFDNIAMYKQLVIDRGVDPEELGKLHVSKVRAVLPAIRREQVSVKQALADAEVLPRRDLETKYTGTASETRGRPDTDSKVRTEEEPQWAVCATCGTRKQIDPHTGEFLR